MMRSLAVAALVAGLLWQWPLPAAAQQNPDYFIPGQSKPPAGAPAPKPGQKPPRPSTASPVQVAPPQLGNVGGGGAPSPLGLGGEAQEPLPSPANLQLPPPPDLPALAKGEAPPVAVIGVMGVPEVMRASAAAQQVEKVIGERRTKLNEDAQKEQAVWREMQQALANDRPKLSGEQVRTRERELQERITNAQRQFRERNRIIQEAAQYALAQIERTLIAVIRQVAEARGMNLVLHRAQVALNVNQFDITDQVAEQLNKILPSVLIPPDGVSASTLARDAKVPVPATQATAKQPVPPPPPPPPVPAAPAPAAPPAPAK
jgi:Skp family chaperone for outer membrane proteins